VRARGQPSSACSRSARAQGRRDRPRREAARALRRLPDAPQGLGRVVGVEALLLRRSVRRRGRCDERDRRTSRARGEARAPHRHSGLKWWLPCASN
jgi:hypothetical protein